MEFLRRIEWTPLNILKAAGVALAGVILIAITFNVLGATLRPLLESAGVRVSTDAIMPRGMTAPSFAGYAQEDAYYGESGDGSYGKGIALSATNVAQGLPPSPRPDGVAGSDAEEYEVTDYNASIETRHKEETCGTIAGWKSYEYVVFENSNEYDRGCSYGFKVAHDHVDEILSALKALRPKELSENTYTIKRQVDDFTSEEDILKKKLASIDDTLESALRAYEEVTALATRTENADSLAKIIDSRIGIIERLTQQRIDTASRLERLLRAKAEQLDKLDYTYFYVNVYENKFIDGENIADSWKNALRGFVRDVNETVQNLTIGLIALALLILQYVIYLLVLLFVAKYLWKAAKWIWNR